MSAQTERRADLDRFRTEGWFVVAGLHQWYTPTLPEECVTCWVALDGECWTSPLANATSTWW